jgi:hypothetical protein
MSASTCCTGSFMLPATPHTNFTSPTLLQTHQGKSLTHMGERQTGGWRSEGGRKGCLEPCDARKWRGVGCPRYTPSGGVRGAGRRGPCLRPRPRLPAPRPCACCLPVAAPAIQKPTHRDGGGDAYGVTPYMNATYMSPEHPTYTLHTPYIHEPHTPYKHTHAHTHRQTHMHTHTTHHTHHTHQQTHMHTYTEANTHTRARTHTHTHTHAQSERARERERARESERENTQHYTHTNTHKYTHTHTHTYTLTHSHTNTHTHNTHTNTQTHWAPTWSKSTSHCPTET